MVDQELLAYPTEVENQPQHPVNSSSNSLLIAIINNDEDALHTALAQATEEDFTRIHSHNVGDRNILTIACVNSSENIFQILFEYCVRNFGHLDFTEDSWYYWETIHFAAYHTSVGKLRIIVNTFLNQKSKLNVLSILSENALHVLLEYGRRTESFNVQLSNGWESRVCHVIAEEKKEVVFCAKLLIDAGIDINHNNIWNETPLIIAIRYRLLGVIELLLKRADIDLDTCKESTTGKSARDLLRENEIWVHLLTPNTMTLSPTKALFTFLKGRDEEMFLRYNNENIRLYVNEMDGDNTSGTMLQLCLMKGYINYETEIASSQEPQETDIMKTPMLKFFCRNGFARSIEHLLNNGAEISKRTKIFGNQDVFQMAVKLSYYPFLAILLEHRSNQITAYHILEVLRNTNEASFESQNFNIRHVLFLLISKLEMFYDPFKETYIDIDRLRILNEILILYLKYNRSSDEYIENICQVLRMGASLTGTLRGHTSSKSKNNLSQISYECLRSHLDECISANNEICCNSFITDDPNGYYSETVVLHALTHDSKKNDLLNHPALLYFIHAKWLKTSKFFYLNLGFYSTFLAVLYWYMVYLQMNVMNKPLFVIFLILLSILTLKEVVQFLLYCPRYFFDISNYLELSIIVSCFINVFIKHEASMIVAILLSTLIFLLMLGQLPQCTKYMIIFSSTKYFLEYASFYFIQFVSFALCFFILLPSDEHAEANHFGAILIRLFDTLIFFIGQYDGDITRPPNSPVFGRIIVAIFIFCMTIILNNLLVGLIVTDMDIIQKTGKQQRQIKMIRYIARIETFLRGTERFFCLRGLRNLFGNTNVFKNYDNKIIKISDFSKAFDGDDLKYLKDIHDNRLHRKNVLNSLYEYIINEIYTDRKIMRDNRDILLKLSRLEEQLRRGRPR